MTNTQYIVGWGVYLLGATGCITSLWLIVKSWSYRLKRLLCFSLSTLLYLPWWTTPEQHWLAPAFFTALYDGLEQGPDAMRRAGFIVLAAIAVSTLLALILPVKKSGSPKQDIKKYF